MSTRPAEPFLGSALAALARGEWEEARERFEQLLGEGEEPAALEGLGWACWWLDETERSLDLRERAYRLYLASEDRRAAARVAIALGVDSFDVRGDAVAGGWLQRANRLLASLPACPEQGWLALWEGHFARYVEQDLARARALASRAGELARALRLQDLELLASSLEGLILVSEGAVAEGMRRIDEATAAAVAGEIRDLDAVGQACCFLVHACEQVWDHLRAAQWGERMKAFCARWRVESLFALCRTQHAATLLRRGDWPAAEAEIEAAMGALTASRSAYAAQGAILLAELRRRQGRAAAAEALLEQAPGLSLTLVCQAALAFDRDDPATALALLGRALRRVRTDNWGVRATALDLRVRAALGQGDLETAREDAATLRTIATAVSTPSFEAVARAAAGRLALAAGDLAAARELLEDAVDLFGEGGLPYEASQARLDLAAVLVRRDLLPLAVMEAQAAHDTLRRLGAAREEERAAALLSSLSPAAASPAPLTAREREVLRLVAQGMADKQVAAQLHLSSHTVHRHVSNILTKLDLSSRAAAVAYATRAGLL